MAKRKRTNNDLQNTTQKIKYQTTRLKSWNINRIIYVIFNDFNVKIQIFQISRIIGCYFFHER